MKIESNFNEVTGVSTIQLYTPIGIFTGIAMLAEEDRPYISKYTGCYIAELRAYKAYYKALLKRKKSEARGMRQINDAINNSISATDTPDLIKASSIAFNNYQGKIREIMKLKITISNIDATIQRYIEDKERYQKERGQK